MSPSRRGGAWCAWAVALMATAAAWGAGGKDAARSKQPPLTKVAFKEYPGTLAAGRAAAYEGEVDEAGLLFYVEGTNIQTAAAVALEAREPGTPLLMHLKNDLSAEWDRTVKTNEKGTALTRFRTEGPASILVRSTRGRTPYRVVFWLGKEVKLHTALPPPFVSQQDYDARHGVGRMSVLIVGAGVAVAMAVGGLFFWRSRRAPRGTP